MISAGFSNWLTKNTELSEGFLDKIILRCNKIQVQKDEFLLQQGGKNNFTFFVEKGLLRYFSIDEKGKEHVLQFAPENWLLSDRESVFFDKPSPYNIQALEDSVLVQISEDLIQQLAEEDDGFFRFNNRLLHNHIRTLQFRINMLLSASAQERYLDFVKTYPDILLRVPQWMVASYLGITPEGLSRVRKQLADSYKSRN